MAHRREPGGSSTMTLAQKIQKYRKMRGMTQEELAEALGVSHQSISKWESGQTTPGLDKVLLLSGYFQVSTDSLLKVGDESEPLTVAAPSPPPHFPVAERPARREPEPLFLLGLAIAVAGLLGLGALWVLSLLNPPYTLGKTLGPIDMFRFYLLYNEIELLGALAIGATLTGAGMIALHRLRRKRAA